MSIDNSRAFDNYDQWKTASPYDEEKPDENRLLDFLSLTGRTIQSIEERIDMIVIRFTDGTYTILSGLDDGSVYVLDE